MCLDQKKIEAYKYQKKYNIARLNTRNKIKEDEDRQMRQP